MKSRSVRRFCFISVFAGLCFLTPCNSFAGTLEIGNGFFYNKQYERAITAFSEVLATDNYDKATKNKIKYKIGLSYFLLGERDKCLELWAEARAENPGMFEGKIFRIPSAGMEPQLIIGDMIIIDNEYYQHNEINRHDIVVFLNPEDPKKLNIKRVIALPGDKIQIKKREVFINGLKLVDIPITDTATSKYEPTRDDFGPLVVPQRSFFLLGDNRDKSYDSRFYGPVKQDLIIGKALVIYGSTPNKDSFEGATLDRTGMIIK